MKAAGKNNRVVIIAIVFTMVATLYSLSELHRMSTEQHSKEDKSHKFATHVVVHEEKTPTTATPAQQASTSSPTESKNTAVPQGQPQASPAVVQSSSSSQSAASSSSGSGDKQCFTYPNTELWGDVLVWGASNKKASVGECCDACRNYKSEGEQGECNVWVYCGDADKCKGQHQQCWLKHLAHPEASKPARQGPTVYWTSGTIDVDINADPSQHILTSKNVDHSSRKFHVVTSAQGTAVHWQIRIHYYWYKKMKAQCEKEGGCEMGGFTRLLHSGHADDLMDEIPSMVVDPLPQDMVEHSWYIVLNRPYAFVQWCKKAKIPERYVFMSEPDHVMIRPLPNFMRGDIPAAFPFFYIEPAKQENLHITQKFIPTKITKAQAEEIAPIGNSPTFMTFKDMHTVMPIWMNTSIAIFKDTEANQVWGWVQEMYGFTIALYIAGIKKTDLYLQLMSQPPWDTEMYSAPGKPFYIIHYTYGMDYKLTGEFTPGKFGEWRFDKRTYSGRPLPRHLGDPPKGMKNDLVRTLINSFNEATAAIPCWDKYAETGKVVKPQDCQEKPGGFLAEEAAKTG